MVYSDFSRDVKAMELNHRHFVGCKLKKKGTYAPLTVYEVNPYELSSSIWKLFFFLFLFHDESTSHFSKKGGVSHFAKKNVNIVHFIYSIYQISTYQLLITGQ